MTDNRAARREMWVLGEWDWWIFHDANRLHSATVEYDPNYEVAGYGRAACGKHGWLAIPGIFTRMSAPRCVNCCRKLNFPRGIGSPKNDDACRPLVEQRIAMGPGNSSLP